MEINPENCIFSKNLLNKPEVNFPQVLLLISKMGSDRDISSWKSNNTLGQYDFLVEMSIFGCAKKPDEDN